VVATITTAGPNPAVAVDSSRQIVYAATATANSLVLIDEGTETLFGQFNIGAQPVALAVDSTRNLVYCLTAGGLAVLGGNVIHYVPNSNQQSPVPQDVAVNVSNGRIYVANLDNTVQVLDGNTGNFPPVLPLVATLSATAGPAGVAVNPVTNVVYVTNSDANNVAVAQTSP